MTTGHWVCDLELNIRDFIGFIYEVTNTITDQKYIGKRNFTVKGESPHAWKNYKSSSKYLKQDIEYFGNINFEFRILELHTSNFELSNREIQIQMQREVLTKLLPSGLNAYYNKNIHGVGFNGTGTTRSSSVRAVQSKAASGNKIYHNPFTGESCRIKNHDEVPAGFINGMLSGTKINMSNARMNSRAFHIPGEYGEIYLKSDDNVPDGYIPGTNPMSKRNQKGENGNSTDRTVYLFENTLTLERFSGTQIKFRTHTGVSRCQCSALVNGRVITTSKWKLISVSET